MTAQRARSRLTRRTVLASAGALTVSFAFAGSGNRAEAAAGPAPIDPNQVDSFLSVNDDGTVTLFCGKVDLGQGLRIAMRQIAGEELGIGVDKIKYVEGDTELTPDQGRTSGSNGIQRGGMQIRHAAATARAALIAMAAQGLNMRADDLVAADGKVRPKSGGAGIRFAALIGTSKFNLKLDPKAPLKNPTTYRLVGKPLPRPDVPAKCTGTFTYMHDFAVPNMVHARVIRPAAIGAKLTSVDESSIKDLPGARVVRIKDFLAVIADDEWTAIRAARALRAQWSDSAGLPEQDKLVATLRGDRDVTDEVLVNRGGPRAATLLGTIARSATYFWPMQSHGSIGPSCAVADVRKDRATIWAASQATHKYRPTFARFLDLPVENVRLIYLDGAGCYGMNGHDDAAADAALLSKAIGMPVRVQWMRADEHGWDPKGPPQLLALEGALGPDGRIAAWRTEMWLPKATAGLPNVPLLGPEAAGIQQVEGLSTGLITQNGDPPYAVPHVEVLVHWLKDAPLRPSNIRAPGKIANCFAVESFVDDCAAAAKADPVQYRLAGLSDPRGIEVLTRAAALIDWQPRPSPSPGSMGRGIAYVHYKHSETYVAIAMEVTVDRGSGALSVTRVGCAHDCGLVINPDALRSQIEGSILQTMSRTLFEEVKFDRARVTSVDWASYPILTFPDVPEIRIDIVERQNEKPWGAGEPTAAIVPAAIANAIYNATGARLRSVPFTPDKVQMALRAI